MRRSGIEREAEGKALPIRSDMASSHDTLWRQAYRLVAGVPRESGLGEKA